VAHHMPAHLTLSVGRSTLLSRVRRRLQGGGEPAAEAAGFAAAQQPHRSTART
jgi:hypothetical protein